MKALITRVYRRSPDGFTIITHNIGETVEGEVAEMAIKSGYAEAIKEPKLEPRKTLTLETKKSKAKTEA